MERIALEKLSRINSSREVGVRSIQYTATYLPAGVLAFSKCGNGMGSRVIRTQHAEFKVYTYMLHELVCMN